MIQVDDVSSPSFELPKLRDRNYDLVLSRLIGPLASDQDDLNIEILFDDRPSLQPTCKVGWARRRKIDPAELVGEPWILTPPNTQLNYVYCGSLSSPGARHAEDQPRDLFNAPSYQFAFQRPVHHSFREFYAALEWRSLRFESVASRFAHPTVSVAIVTVKNRTLSPVVERFIACAREVTKSLVKSK